MNNFFKIYLPILVIVFFAFYITSKFIEPAPKKELIIAAGSKGGTYYNYAKKYKEVLEKEKVKVTILETKGSIENIKLLNEGKAHIGFTQNGILDNNRSKNLESLASIYYEPLWIFYKNSGFEMNYIVELTGKKISIGIEGSGTKDLAKRLLTDNSINNKNSKLLELNSTDAKEKLKKGEIDAMFIVVSPDSKIVKELLADPSIEVLNIKRAKAYSRKYTFLEPLSLYEGTMDLYKNIPYEDTFLLSTTANLLVKEGVPHELIRLFLKKIKEFHNKKGLFAKENQFPNLLHLDAKINEESKKYLKNGDSWLEGIFPYWVASNIDRLKILLIPLITLLIPIFKWIIPLYRWSIRSKIYKWYDKLYQLDKEIETISKDSLEKELENLEEIKHHIKSNTKVPLSYMGEYYNLLMHINLLENKILNRLREKGVNI